MYQKSLEAYHYQLSSRYRGCPSLARQLFYAYIAPVCPGTSVRQRIRVRCIDLYSPQPAKEQTPCMETSSHAHRLIALSNFQRGAQKVNLPAVQKSTARKNLHIHYALHIQVCIDIIFITKQLVHMYLLHGDHQPIMTTFIGSPEWSPQTGLTVSDIELPKDLATLQKFVHTTTRSLSCCLEATRLGGLLLYKGSLLPDYCGQGKCNL